jgi:aspartyl-tRNA(Asn)/glutamyl-tRNA(Gln) amidotransferase subunit C
VVAIGKEEIRHIAKLANLEFSDSEIERFSRQFNAILEYVAQLDRLDTDAIAPTFHVDGGAHALRDDRVAGSIPQDEALANAPESAHGLFKVPRVLG